MKTRTLLGAIGTWLLAGQVLGQSVLFDFENAQAGSSLPITLTVGGITAQFSSTGLGGFYVQQPQTTIQYTPPGFSGNCLNPTSVNAADLHVAFSVPLTDFSMLYSPQELACDSSATLRITAYLDGALIGTATTNATAMCTCTWASQYLRFHSAQGFNSVVVHYDAPPACQDYGVIFLADNLAVIPAPPPIILTDPTRLGSGAFQFSFSNAPGRGFTVFGSTNLFFPVGNWTLLPGLTEGPPGQFQFVDPQATNYARRFYQVRSP
jgi:hypothetical protein